MTFPANWKSPITASPGQLQSDVNPLQLLPSRTELSKGRLDVQLGLLDSGTERHTPIQVTSDGVIWDGHHGVRAAAEKGIPVMITVVPGKVNPTAETILDLPVE